jgi:hypothetical protein
MFVVSPITNRSAICFGSKVICEWDDCVLITFIYATHYGSNERKINHR